MRITCTQSRPKRSISLTQAYLFLGAIIPFVFTTLTVHARTEPAISPTPLVATASDNAWLEIDTAAFENNLRILQEKVVTDGTEICAVLKADAYGHGLALLLPSVMKHNINAICITHNEEAKVARELGFTGRIVRIRSASLQDIELGLPFGLEEMIGTLDGFRTVSQMAQQKNISVKTHLNLNSAGMGRNGLDLDTEVGKQAALEIVALPNVEIVGIMTHFPIEDRPGLEAGLDKFQQQARWLIDNAKLDRNKITLHCANTVATVTLPSSHLDMVRPGSFLYGQQPSDSRFSGIKTIMSFKTRVASVHQYKKGDSVGYDKTFTLARDSKLANLPVGYSDGYNREFSNRAQVLIGGKRFPIVGRVSMNTVMVDVTNSSVRPSDEVVLLGLQGSEEISIAELMANSYSMYGEFFVHVGESNPRYAK